MLSSRKVPPDVSLAGGLSSACHLPEQTEPDTEEAVGEEETAAGAAAEEELDADISEAEEDDEEEAYADEDGAPEEP